MNGAGTLVWHGKCWHARWRSDGKLISRSTGTADLDQAREWLATHSAPRIGMRDRAAVTKLTRLVAASLDDADTRRRTLGIPLARLFEIWRDSPDRRDVAEATLNGYRMQLAALATWTKKRYPEITSARDVSQTVADEYVRERAATVSASRVNRDLNLFAMVWRSLSRRYGLDYNPWSSDHIARRRHTPVERRALTDEEVDALLANSTDEMHLMIRLGISTGLRLGDIVNLRWTSVDMERREIAIKRTRKTGAPIVLPMVAELYNELLEPSRHAVNEWVLPHTHKRAMTEVSHSSARVFRNAGIEMRPTLADGSRPKTPTASFHSLRHTFVTRLMRRGISPALIQAAVGHSTMLMTEHYTHISSTDLARGLANETTKKRHKTK